MDGTEKSKNISHFNGMYWNILRDDKLKELVYKYISETDKMATDNIDSFCKNVATYIKYEVTKKRTFSEDDFMAISNRVVFNNGVYDVQTGEIYPFDKGLPYYFAIDAKYIEEGDTPTYDKLKSDATRGDEDSMNMFDLMIAYMLIPNRSGKCFFVMANAKDSGKSILGQFIANLFVGNKAKSIDPEHLQNRFAFSGMDEAVIMSCLEMNTDRLKKQAVAMIKCVTGDSFMRVEEKYKNEQTTAIRCKLLLATNGGIYLPAGMEDSAFYRRVIVIPFIQSTPKDELMADMRQRLWEERDAILSKCVRKLQKYIDNSGGIVFPESVLSISMKEEWMGGKNYDDEFIEETFISTWDPKDRISVNDIEKLYLNFLKIKQAENRDGIQTDRKSLIDKILSKFPSAEKKKERVKSIFSSNAKKPEMAITRIAVRDDVLENINVYE